MESMNYPWGPKFSHATQVPQYQHLKWETCRGIGNSFAYNRNENADNVLKPKELVHTLIRVTANNGNLLIGLPCVPLGLPLRPFNLAPCPALPCPALPCPAIGGRPYNCKKAAGSECGRGFAGSPKTWRSCPRPQGCCRLDSMFVVAQGLRVSVMASLDVLAAQPVFSPAMTPGAASVCVHAAASPAAYPS